ncbi:hypothetical protein TNCV_526351 [Trichonephila clavipes]|nr:hypothetical protein TNCV_526351 [Trichonephila clavipes]
MSIRRRNSTFCGRLVGLHCLRSKILGLILLFVNPQPHMAKRFYSLSSRISTSLSGAITRFPSNGALLGSNEQASLNRLPVGKYMTSNTTGGQPPL